MGNTAVNLNFPQAKTFFLKKDNINYLTLKIPACPWQNPLFLYTLLMYRVEAAIEAVGLDPMPGFLHAAEYGKKALVFDLMEEFRTPVADTIYCSLFNLNILAENDFDPADKDIPKARTDRAYPEIPVFLTHEGIKKVISIFEKKIESTSYYQPLNAEIALKTIILEQVKYFKRVILGEETEYQGYKYK
jgi:CRISPR-associated protein Cas1